MHTLDRHEPALITQLITDDRWTSSVIRDLLIHARQPNMLSLAGGLPAAALLPAERCQVASERLLTEYGPTVLQYGLTRGEPELQRLLVRPISPDPDRLLITAGSQQALDLIARLASSATDSASVVAFEDPGYLGASQVFRSYSHQLVGIPVDHEGICVDVLESRLASGLRPRLCYVNPTFQNPTGASLTSERGRRLVELAEAYDFLVIADDPYAELALDATPNRPPLPGSVLPGSVLPESPQVVRLGSMSKTMAPGLRVGWIDADPRLVTRLALVKQGADLHTSTFNQLLVAEVLSDHRWWLAHLDGLRDHYRVRRLMLRTALQRHLPSVVVTPQGGGFFLWCDLGVAVDALLPAALERGVAFVPGAAFGIDAPATTSIRLSYSSVDPALFDEALRRLASALATIER